MSDLHKKISISRLPPMGPPGLGGGPSNARKARGRKDYTPTTWDKYYDRMKDVPVGDGNTFRLYECGDSGPVCFFLHGGGFSGLSWALLSQCLSSHVICRCAAMDMRGHGDSVTTDEEDLSADRMAKDVADVIRGYYGDNPPPLILIGHSMGGAIAVHTAHKKLIPSLIGLAVIDVVEGTALDALTGMQSYLRGRPKHFKTVENAVEYCVRGGVVRNLESARVSMVGQLKREDNDQTVTSDMEHRLAPEVHQDTNTIAEEDEGDEPSITPPPQSPSHFADSCYYTWRIDLSRTEKFWRGWFEGLSGLFLSCDVPKMLFLAGMDRLDKELVVGQMQGKFQMQVLPQCGHAVHEDVPDKVADVLATFMLRHNVTQPRESFEKTFPSV